ncbi:MAG TPA: hypothetical protein VNJ04_05135 [Gemmatimonadaceae bacterium]|nr:hypothetical protein [Gemmatimonadaceae bacterium]
MASNFRALWKYLVPAWLNTGDGELVGYTLMYQLDVSIERLRLGHLARFPQNGPNGETAPTDALAALGRDRGVIRGIEENDAGYAYRLTQWLVDARTRGTAFTLMRQLHAYLGTSAGVSFRIVDVRGNWYSRSAAGVETSSLNTGTWNWEGDLTKWSRFWVIIYPGTRWVAESTWGTSLWGDTSGTWGSTAAQEHVASMRTIVADWKPAGTRGDIILALDPATFSPTAPEPDGNWGKWYYGANAPPYRLATGRYFGA